jgi:iron complex outermembrane receptor protein
MHLHVRSRSARALATVAAFVVAAPLAAQQLTVVAGTVVDAASGRPIQGANVSLTATRQGSMTDADGRYRFTAAPGRQQIRVRYVGYVMAVDSVTLAEGQVTTRDFSLKAALTSLDQVVVTGTRQPNRTAVDAPVPVDVFTAAEIKQTGRTETSQILELLAPSVNFPRPTVTDGTDHIRPITLRGLNSDQVLVLVNGKRRHNSSLVNINGSVGRGSMAVDLNAIPPSAIDHIEILRDGAAAQYGSDAIAGVINIILKSNAPTTLSAQYGQTKEGDGASAVLDGSWSASLPRSGFFNLSGEFRHTDSTNRAGLDTRQQYFAGDPRNGTPVLNSWVGDPRIRAGAGMFNMGIPLAGSMQFYAFGGLSFSNGLAAGFFRRPNDDRTVRAIYPNGYLPLIESHIWDGSGSVGVKGSAASWDWDLGTVYGRNSFRYDVDHSLNVSYGAASQTKFYAGTMIFDQWTTNLDVQRGFDIGFAQPLSVAWGAEARRDHYGLEAGEHASYDNGGQPILDGPDSGKVAAVGAQVFPGFRPSDATSEARTNYAGYVDFATNPLESWLVDVAGRVEHYSDFGSTTTGKFSTRWEPVKGYAVRGSISNGFRAPSLGQEWFSTTSTNFINVNGTSQPFDIRTFPVTSAQAKVLGAEPLRPEKSKNYGAGLTMEPNANLSFTADYYRIDIKDRVVLSGNFTGAAIQTMLQNAGFTGVNGGRFFTNAIDTRTEGLDLVGQTGMTLGTAGTLRFTGSYNHNYTHVTRIARTPPQLAAFQAVLFDRTQVGLTQDAQPHDNFRLTGDYSYRNLGLVLSEARFGSVTSRATSPANDQTFGAKWTTDVSLSWRMPRSLGLTIGADNIFNAKPDAIVTQNSSGGIFVYSGLSPFGYNGAFYYARISYGL